MSYPLGHFGLGAGLTAGLTTVVLLATRRKISIERDVGTGLIGGAWATLAEVYKLIPIQALKTLHDSWWADIFWFHHVVDIWLDPADDALISAVLFAFGLTMLGILLLISWLAKRHKTRRPP